MARPRRRDAGNDVGDGRMVAYVRVSALMGRGGADFHSPDLQLSAIRRIAAGLREVAVIEDIDETGRNFERSGIEKIRRLAEARQIDVLAVYNVSRLGRNVLESLQFLSWLADRGVTVMSACEQIDTSTASGRWMLTQMLSVAQMQSDQIGDSWSHVIDKRARSGEHHGRPIGYARVDRRLVPDPVLGPAMTDAFTRYARDESVADIARLVAAARGSSVRPVHLKRWLRNPVYRGNVTVGGEVLDGNHEPLVDERTWRRVQDRLARDTDAPPRHHDPSWSMVGLAVCPLDHRLVRYPHRHRKTDEWVQRLMCGSYKHRAMGGCEGIGFPLLDLVEAKMLEDVEGYIRLLRTDSDARMARMARAAASRTDAATLKARVSQTRTAMAKITTEWGLNRMPDEAYREAMAGLRLAESAAAAELSRTEQSVALPTPVEMANAAEEMLMLWPTMLPAERVKALRTVVQKIVVRKAERWREPESDRTQVIFL